MASSLPLATPHHVSSFFPTNYNSQWDLSISYKNGASLVGCRRPPSQ